MINRKTVFVAVAAMLALPALLSAGVLKPGKWETTIEIEAVGLEATPDLDAKLEVPSEAPKKREPIVIVHCITPEEADHPVAPKMPKESRCTVENYKFENNTMTWSMTCPNDVKGTGSMRYSEESYEGTLEITMGERSKTQTYRGKRIGDCGAE